MAHSVTNFCFQTRNAVFTANNYLVDNFFVNSEVPIPIQFERVVF